MNATATSGLPVSLASATPDVCSVSGSIVGFDQAGTCTIDATQAGDDEWLPASAAESTTVVAGAPRNVEAPRRSQHQ